MTDINYMLADVFTDHPFGGNQLAVFLDAQGLTGEQMQSLARELNLPESSFVTPGSLPDSWRVRIFTPGGELPFAGHPTIGTAVVLAGCGRAFGLSSIVLEEGVGPVRVDLGPVAGHATLFMDGAPETHPCPAPPNDVAAVLGLEPEALVGAIWQASYGPNMLFVKLADPACLPRITLRADRWEAMADMLSARAIYPYAVAGDRDGTMLLRARMFAPGMGIPEDPATGSAVAALAGSFPDAPADGVLRLEVSQGVEMGRPSTILASVTRVDGQTTQISVGGSAVVVGEGRFIRLP
jgi:trans-2,3-dihydro-3-hydroxyanthranilate isomerase